MERIQGTVKWWSEELGYGFILGDDDRDYFIHFKDIKEKGKVNLFRGQRVNFFMDKDEKGYRAMKLHYERDMSRID